MISLIAAINQARTIGHQGGIPWNIPSDLKHFKKITKGKNVIMGRKTHESIGRLLDDRRNYIVGRSLSAVSANEEHIRCHSPSPMHAIWDAVNHSWRSDTFIIGGTQIYQEALNLHKEWQDRWGANLIDRMIISDVDDDFEGDTKFPVIDPKAWAITSEGPWIQEPGDQYRYRILEFVPVA